MKIRRGSVAKWIVLGYWLLVAAVFSASFLPLDGNPILMVVIGAAMLLPSILVFFVLYLMIGDPDSAFGPSIVIAALVNGVLLYGLVRLFGLIYRACNRWRDSDMQRAV